MIQIRFMNGFTPEVHSNYDELWELSKTITIFGLSTKIKSMCGVSIKRIGNDMYKICFTHKSRKTIRNNTKENFIKDCTELEIIYFKRIKTT